ncbi:MAG: tetratricopeptide repeat protein [Clostridia bacterium]|nr:tetratricopeptide repeat protein [Clostridia bacterium]
MDDTGYIKAEDYEEPACLLCGDDGAKSIDTRRFISRLDGYYAKKDNDGAERHLKYWLAEAESAGDLRGQFTVYNEMMGFYRKAGRYAEAKEAAKQALGLIDRLGIGGQASAGTAYVNTATVYKTASEPETALIWFEKAKAVYEVVLGKGDGRLGGLYNNMALALSDLKRYDEATGYFEKAIEIMSGVKDGELEEAISYLNLADTKEAQLGAEAAEELVSAYLEKAWELFSTPTLVKDGYYAFVCEKSAPTFEYYGYFAYANKLKEEAKRIYEGT